MKNLAFKIMDEVNERYNHNDTKLQIMIHNFTRLEAMMKALKEDLNNTKDFMCGEFLGNFTSDTF